MLPQRSAAHATERPRAWGAMPLHWNGVHIIEFGLDVLRALLLWANPVIFPVPGTGAFAATKPHRSDTPPRMWRRGSQPRVPRP